MAYATFSLVELRGIKVGKRLTLRPETIISAESHVTKSAYFKISLQPQNLATWSLASDTHPSRLFSTRMPAFDTSRGTTMPAPQAVLPMALRMI